MSADDASDALRRAQRQATVRLWTTAIAVVLTFAVGAVGFLRVQAQRSEAERLVAKTKQDAVLLKREYQERREALEAERSRWLDGSLWQAYRRFSACDSPVGQVLTAFEAVERVRRGELASDRPWMAAMSDGLARCPRLIYSTPMAPKWSVVSYSPDGHVLVAGCARSGIIKLWDLATGREKSTLCGHTAGVNSLAFSPNGKMLASASEDRTVVLWEVATGRPRLTFRGHSGAVRCVCFNADGATVASSGEQEGVLLWDAATGRQEGEPARGSTGARSFAVSFSPDGRSFAACCLSGTIALQDVARHLASGGDRLQERLRTGRADDVRSLCFDSEGSTLAAGTASGAIALWNLSNARGDTSGGRRTLEGRRALVLGRECDAQLTHGSRVLSVQFRPGDSVLASAGSDGAIRLWDVASREAKATLPAHTGGVRSLSFSSDGAWLASAGEDGAVKVWSVEAALAESPDSLAALAASDVHVPECLSISTDGMTIATGDRDGVVVLWDVETGRRIAALQAHSDGVLDLSFSPEGTILASASKDHTVRLWNLATGRRKGVLKGHTEAVTGVCFSPDHTLIASASEDGTLRLWDAETSSERASYGHVMPAAHSICFSPDGGTLAAGGDAGVIGLWDAATGRMKPLRFGVGVKRVCSLDFSPDGATLASADGDGAVRLWDVAAGKQQMCLATGSEGATCVRFNLDGSVVATGSPDGSLRIWDPSTGRQKARLPAHVSSVVGVGFVSDGTALVSAGRDGVIKLWRLSTPPKHSVLLRPGIRAYDLAFSPDGMTLACGGGLGMTLLGAPSAKWPVDAGPMASVSCLTYSPDGSRLATGTWKGLVSIWNTKDGRLEKTLKAHSDLVHSLRFSPDGTLLASGGEDQEAKLWDVASWSLKETLKGYAQPVSCVRFSPDGSLLASADRAGVIHLWDVTLGEEVAVLREHALSAECLSFSPDGAMLASVGADRVIQFWDVAEARKTASIETGEKAYTVSYHGLLSFSSVCFSPDGTIVASAIHEETIKLWDVRTGRQLAVLRGHESKVRSLCFSPDGTTLASVSFEGMVRQWDVTAYASMPHTREGVERFTGGRLDEYEVAPLPLHVYRSARPQHLTAVDHLKWEPADNRPVESNPFLVRHWLNQNANGWLRAARSGAVKAMYTFALIQESQGNSSAARDLHRETAKKEVDARDPWAAKSQQRLKTIPWLLPRFEIYARAVRCFEKGDFDGGMAAHRRASRAYHVDRARLQSELATYLADRATLHLSQRALKWAERECRLAMELGGESHDQHFALAQILEARREPRRARTHYERAVSLAPPDDVIGQKAAQALARLAGAQTE